MTTHIALLRAVNVGGTGKLPMAALREACTEAGLARVSTYIASGNLLFESPLSAQAAAALVTGILRERFGLLKNEVILRSLAELEAVVANNPLPEVALARPKLYYASFLLGPPRPDAASLLAAWPGPERILLGDGCAYIDYPEGAGTSKLTPSALERMLGTPSTARNWNTVTTLLRLGREVQP
jgi:uncharacterized protein (DUF1697 family)